MTDMDTLNPLFHVDLLTGCSNLVSFSKSLEENFGNTKFKPVSFIVVDVYQLRDINKTRGFSHGDSILRWMGIAIKDETGAMVYRIAGDNFVAVLIGGAQKSHVTKARKLFKRLNSEARQLELNLPVARMAVIQFPKGAALNPAIAWKNINEKFPATINPADPVTSLQVHDADVSETDKATLRAIELMAHRIENLGGTLQHTFRLAYTDPISGAPNLLAIQRRLELTLSEAILNDKPLCLCMIDGDNLKHYNNHGYQAGDDAIRRIYHTLNATLRPEDFIGRWRMGDEFIIILPSTTIEQAGTVAERLRKSVERASKGWLYPVTVSIGVSHFPKHGFTANQLLKAAEEAVQRAKAAGKNQVAIAI